jgi:hypothetical protein
MLTALTEAANSTTQGSQAPLRDFDQLVGGPWPISTSCPPGGLWGRGSAFWRENWSKHPPFPAQNFDQLVDNPFKISEALDLRPSNVDPSTSLRALQPPNNPWCCCCDRELLTQQRCTVGSTARAYTACTHCTTETCRNGLGVLC